MTQTVKIIMTETDYGMETEVSLHCCQAFLLRSCLAYIEIVCKRLDISSETLLKLTLGDLAEKQETSDIATK